MINKQHVNISRPVQTDLTCSIIHHWQRMLSLLWVNCLCFCRKCVHHILKRWIWFQHKEPRLVAGDRCTGQRWRAPRTCTPTGWWHCWLSIPSFRWSPAAPWFSIDWSCVPGVVLVPVVGGERAYGDRCVGWIALSWTGYEVWRRLWLCRCTVSVQGNSVPITGDGWTSVLAATELLLLQFCSVQSLWRRNASKIWVQMDNTHQE